MNLLKQYRILFLLFIFSQAKAHVIMNVGTYVRPDEKNIKEVVHPLEWFSSDVKIQTGGTCGTYSAVALAEAHCKHFAGVSVDISEAFQIYRIISDQFRDDNGKIVVDAYNTYLEEGNWPEKSFPQVVLERIKNGLVCTKQEFVEPDTLSLVDITQNKFEALHQEVVKASADAAAEASKEIRYKGEEDIELAASSRGEELVKLMGRKIMSVVDERADNSARIPAYDGTDIKGVGLLLKTQDLQLQKCVSTMGDLQVTQNPTTDQMKKWLDADYPLVCVINSLKNISSTTFTYKLYSKTYTKPNHSTIVYGYRYSPKSKRTEFLVRDSNFKKVPTYSVSGCDTIVAIKENENAIVPVIAAPTLEYDDE